jgi:biotin transport system substrate-specific component
MLTMISQGVNYITSPVLTRPSLATDTRRVTQAALFAVLMVAGAFARLPLFGVPLTLQTFFVYLSGLLVDPWTAGFGQALYLLLGLLGLPVFAGGLVGPQALLGPTGGFLLSFPIAAFFESWTARSGSAARRLAGLAVAFGVIFGMGGSFFAAYFSTWDLNVVSIFLPFMLWDAAKAALAYGVARSIGKAAPSRPTSAKP